MDEVPAMRVMVRSNGGRQIEFDCRSWASQECYRALEAEAGLDG